MGKRERERDNVRERDRKCDIEYLWVREKQG